MRNGKQVLYFCGVVGLMSGTATSWAETSGYVQFVNGEVSATPENGVQRSLHKGDPINEGDAVSTSQNAVVQVRMQDGGLIALREGTQLKFGSFRFSNKAGQPEKSHFLLLKGGIRSVTGLLGHTNKQEYEIGTPLASIVMRGADHEAIYLPDSIPGADAGTYSKVNQGEAALGNYKGVINVLPNQMGFAGGVNRMPRILPINSDIFAVSVAPRVVEASPENKPDTGDQAKGQTRKAAVTDKKEAATKPEQRPDMAARSEKAGTDSGPIRSKSVMDYTRSELNIDTKAAIPLVMQDDPFKAIAVAYLTPQTLFPAIASHSMLAATIPVDSLNVVGTMNKATLSVDLTNQLVNAALNITMTSGLMTGIYTVTANNLPINTVTLGNVSSSFGGNSKPTVSCSGTCASAAGYSASILGTVSDSASLAYNIWPTTAVNATVIDQVQGTLLFSTAAANIPPSAAYNPNNIAVESADQFGMNLGGIALPADLGYATVTVNKVTSRAGLTSIKIRNPGGGIVTTTSSVQLGTAGSASVANAAAGIQYGSWRLYTGQDSTPSMQLGALQGTVPVSWMYGPQGYLDTPTTLSAATTGAVTGVFTYQMDGATSPHSVSSGLNGTLNSAAISVNFATMLVSANLSLAMPGNEMWAASMSNQAFSAAAFSSTPATLVVTHGISTATTCTTCGGNLAGAFTGQNYAGAIMSYSLYNNAQSVSTVAGNVAFTRVGVAANPVVTNATPPPAPTGSSVLALGGGVVQSSVAISATTGPLTDFAWVSTNGMSNHTTVNCPTCTATASGQVATSGIYYGNWSAGTLTQISAAAFNAGSLPSGYWITGPEAGPLYLPQALTGTASFTFNAGQVSNGKGYTGTVLNSSALTLDFNRQTVGINLDVSIVDAATGLVTHTWNAQTRSGNTAALGQGALTGGASFQASTANIGGGSGLLAVTVDGGTAVVNPYARVNGQLTGSGLTGAIISFNLNGLYTAGALAENISGVAAFTATPSYIATPYRYVATSYYDPYTAVPQAALGLYANNATRVTQDTAGNLTRFDTQTINSATGSKTYANNTGTLADHGTDPVSGISWGRWSGGTINVTDRASGAMTTVTQAGSLHWITEPVASSATTLPLTGVYTYVRAGGTSPTDNLGKVGTLNSATLAADFTAQTVNLSVNTTVNGATLNATGSNVPIVQRTAFYASSQEPAASTSYLTVACSGTCGTTTGGTVIGKFSGAGATGAAMSYGLQNGVSTISGVVAFHR